MNSHEIDEWRRKRLALVVEEMGSSGALGEAIGLSSGSQIRGMLSGTRALSQATMDKIEALPGRKGWFFRDGAVPEGQTILGCLRFQREFLELLAPEKRQAARIMLKHFADSPDELLEVAQALQKLADES